MLWKHGSTQFRMSEITHCYKKTTAFSSVFFSQKMINILEFAFPLNSFFTPLPSAIDRNSGEKLELHLRRKNISHKMWPGGSQCKNAVKRREKGCQSSQTWPSLFTVITFMSPNVCGNEWRLKYIDVEKLHKEPSWQSNIETEKLKSIVHFHCIISLGSISMQTPCSILIEPWATGRHCTELLRKEKINPSMYSCDLKGQLCRAVPCQASPGKQTSPLPSVALG